MTERAGVYGGSLYDLAAEEQLTEPIMKDLLEVREIFRVSQEPFSLDTPIGEDGESCLGDFIPAESAYDPAELACAEMMKTFCELFEAFMRPRYAR